ncbi:SusC/RagA family TonB-linked outer membrane protein [Spirosoma flavum]|uniref:SusC/RagA family TonB-linked outer membrane protein n=1 Tax=Spirosoma flavum TaxID=2048557 RepID=A0ABW6ASJ9_9BACT
MALFTRIVFGGVVPLFVPALLLGSPVFAGSPPHPYSYTADQPQRTITGTVTDEKNGPLPGATVQLKGSNSGTTTDANGKFSLSVPDGKAVIVISFIGFDPKEIEIGSQTSLTVQLTPGASQLDEVVVKTGYGTELRKNIISSIATVKAEDFNQGVVTSPAQLLQGKVAGLNITRSGNPNQSAQSIVLRGPSTLREGAAQEPFYVIDGVPDASINLIPPDDIVSIDILRDASATAIYGARAANGVILVTTRRGKEGQSRVSYNGYGGIEQVSKRIDVLTGDEIRGYLKANGKALNPVDDDTNNGVPVNTDWQKEVTRTAYSHNHTLSFDGGTANTLYGASVNYLNNQGIMRGSSRERMIIRANIQQKALNDRLRLSLSLSNSDNLANNIPNEVFGNMVAYLPTVNVRNADGTFKENLARGNANPLSLIETNTLNTRTKTFLANGQIQATLLPGLDYNLSLSSQNEQIDNNTYANRYSLGAYGANGLAIRSSYTNTKRIIESYFSYNKQFGEHGLKLLAGYSWQQDRTGDGFQSSNKGFVSDATTYNNLSLGSPPTGYLTDYGTVTIKTLRLISYYGRVNYQYADRYLLQASIRRDGSSAFGTNNQWGLFPAVSVGWRINNERFMENIHLFDDLKLRAGYGVTGNSLGFDPFISLLRYNSTGKFYYNGNFINGIGPTQNPNPNLKWEQTAMYNVGLDFSVLKNRLSGTLEFYNKLTSDLIWTYGVSTTQFFVNTLTANAGKMRNVGVELTLAATPIQSKRVTWRTSVNLAHNDNKIETLSNDVFTLNQIPTAYVGGKGQSGNSSQIVKEGLPVGTFNTWKYAGLNEKGVSQFQKADGTLTTTPTSSDFVPTGSAQPKLLFGWNNSVRFGAFDLNVFLRGVTGNKILNATLAGLNSPADANAYNQPRIILKEPITDINSYLLSDRYIEDGSYIRLDNATLGYTVKTGSKVLKNLRFYATGTNLFTLTHYQGIDPEISLGGLTPGIDQNNFYPKTRSYVFGANISF